MEDQQMKEYLSPPEEWFDFILRIKGHQEVWLDHLGNPLLNPQARSQSRSSPKLEGGGGKRRKETGR